MNQMILETLFTMDVTHLGNWVKYYCKIYISIGNNYLKIHCIYLVTRKIYPPPWIHIPDNRWWNPQECQDLPLYKEAATDNVATMWHKLFCARFMWMLLSIFGRTNITKAITGNKVSIGLFKCAHIINNEYYKIMTNISFVLK